MLFPMFPCISQMCLWILSNISYVVPCVPMHLPNVFMNFIQCPYVVPHVPMHLPNVFLNFIQCICQMFLVLLNHAFYYLGKD
jgi:hypothetical protein